MGGDGLILSNSAPPIDANPSITRAYQSIAALALALPQPARTMQ